MYEMTDRREIFQRTELLFGKDKMQKMAETSVIIFGIGGVGSWCAESLARSGIGHITLVDSDRIAVSNINRQLHATTRTVGEVKTEVLKNRLLEINPYADIQAIQAIYGWENRDDFKLEKYDYIIDAIDSLSNKADLIRTATRTKAVFFSSLGAALKMDPSKIRVAEFWKVRGCPLGAKLRKRLKRGDPPSKEFYCVYSEELLENVRSNAYGEKESDEPGNMTGQASGSLVTCQMDTDSAPGNPELAYHDWTTKKAVVNGTVAHITAIFGFTLAGLVIKDLYLRDG